MQRRAALARAFAPAPWRLLMDEPFVSLDAPTVMQLRGLLLDLCTTQRPTVIFVTHDLHEATLLADRVLFLGTPPTRVIGTAQIGIARERRRDQALVDTRYADLKGCLIRCTLARRVRPRALLRRYCPQMNANERELKSGDGHYSSVWVAPWPAPPSRTGHAPHPQRLLALATCLCLLWAPPLWAATAIAVLDFELNDLTPLPATPEELARTASIRPLLEQALKDQGTYRLVPIPSAALTQANVGFGYVYDHPEVAAALGRAHGADWVLVGRLHKPSFLFAYLLGRLVNTDTGQVAANLVVEAKGPAMAVTRRAAARLAEQIHRTSNIQGAVSAATPAQRTP